MRSKPAIAISVVLAVVGGCANGSATVPNGCPPWLKPITLSLDDRLTETTELEILNHNDKWDDLCGGSVVVPE